MIIKSNKNKGGFIMEQENIALSILYESNGYLSSKHAKEKGVKNTTLLRMEERGVIERIAHGLYIGADIIPDRFFIMQYRCSKGIYSHLTAMYLHNLSDRDPIRLTMTVPTGMNTKSFTDENIIFYYSNPNRIMLGMTEIESMSGKSIKVYDIERTICDCLKSIEKMDNDLVLTGLKRYLQSKSRDSTKLLDYATEFKMRDIIRRYLEVL